MTQLTLSMLLKAEGAPAAKAAIQDVAKSTDALGTATTKGVAADRAATSAKQASARASQQLTTANRQAAAATGNLVAQFNDIFMMIGSGQNPLTTAVQQGTQITQAFGSMGAGAAIKSVGSALMAMVSPLNLITLGAIAAGSAMIQWLTSASAESDATAAALERQKDALQGIVAETEKLRLQREMMLSGAKSEDEQLQLNRIKELMAEREAIQQRLNTYIEAGGRFSGYALQTERQALETELADVNAKIEALQKQRELNAATETGQAVAEKLKSATLGVTSALQGADGSRLVAAFAAAFPTASALLGIAQNIVATIGGAAQIQAQASGGRYLDELNRTGQDSGPDSVRTRIGGGGRFAPPVIGPGQRTYGGGRGGGGGGGGGGAARDEANALQELITSLEGEIEALRTQDPIQKEMLKNREALKGATEAEKKKVEELIATREREQVLMEGAKARAAFFEDLGNNALEALIVKGQSFNDVLKNIAQSLIQAGIQAALFGSGPFGSLFGDKSIISMIFPALGAGKAGGGRVFGPGDGTKDTFLTPTANGEYVVNARATARNLHLLEAINAGAQVTAGRAEGGRIGSDSRRMTARSGSELPATIYLDMRGVQGDREIEAIARRSAAQVVAMYDKEGLPVSIQRVSGDPRRQG
jgi:Prophage tail length tape measure protein